MKKAKIIMKLLVIVTVVLLLGLTVGTSQAQGQDLITAQVDRDVLTTDESLWLTVSVDASAGAASQPLMPVLDGFQILSSSSGQQITIVNGKTSRQTTYQYQLRPLRTGQLEIGTVAIDINGTYFTTEPIVVTVSQGTGVPQQPANPRSSGLAGSSPLSSLLSQLGMGSLSSFFGNQQPQAAAPAANSVPVEPAPAPDGLAGQDYFLEAVVDNPTPYQGQQLTYTMRFYQAVNSGGLEYQPPSFTGFWSEQLPDQGEYSIQEAGRTYRVTVLWTTLFPTGVGETIIDPARLNVAADFFSRGGTLQTAPVSVNVQPLPDPAPADFRGAVGRFDISATADKESSVVNDTVTWQVTVNGAGNIESLPDPVWPESPEWRAFDSDAVVESALDNGFVVGSRSYERVLVPTVPGDLSLPSLNYTYFDPYNGEYNTVSSDPIQIFVEDDGSGSMVSSPVAATGPVADTNSGSLPGIGPDIFEVKQAPASWNQGAQPITQRDGFWLLWTVPLFLLVGQFSWQRWHRSRQDNVYARRSQQAAGKARQALRKATKEPATRHEAAGTILNGYLSEKLNQPVAGLNQTQLAHLLKAQGVAPETINDTTHLLSVSEMGRFSPGENDFASGNILKAAEEVINELDKSL